MRFVLKIDCDNAAFQDPYGDGTVDPLPEISGLLREASFQVGHNRNVAGVLHDVNGNAVGEFCLHP